MLNFKQQAQHYPHIAEHKKHQGITKVKKHAAGLFRRFLLPVFKIGNNGAGFYNQQTQCRPGEQTAPGVNFGVKIHKTDTRHQDAEYADEE
jgi:hypothetical protein